MATSGRSCSEGSRLFFEADFLPGEIIPDPRHIHMHTAPGQSGSELLKRQVMLCAQPRQKPIALTRQFGAVVATHWPRLKPPGRAKPMPPLDARARTHVKVTRRRPRRHAFGNQTAETIP